MGGYGSIPVGMIFCFPVEAIIMRRRVCSARARFLMIGKALRNVSLFQVGFRSESLWRSVELDPGHVMARS